MAATRAATVTTISIMRFADIAALSSHWAAADAFCIF